MLVAVAFSSRRADAGDPFEIQVYDGTANAPLQPGLELHVNQVANGLESGDGATLAPHGQTHFTLEPSLGLTPWWELGAYFQTAIVQGSGYEYAGAKLRSKFVTPPKWHPNLRLGANFELSLLPERFDHDRWGTELRPIVAWENDLFLFALNANVSTPLGGPGFRDGPHFEPAGMAVVKIAGLVGAGLEYYSGLGPIAGLDKLNDEEHYLFEVLNLLAVDALELNVGIGEWLTSASNKLVLKLIVGYEFDTMPSGSATDPSAKDARRLRGPRGAYAGSRPRYAPLL